MACYSPFPHMDYRNNAKSWRRTINERCERAAAIANETPEPVIVWCHLNDEGNMLERLIPDAVQVSGSDSDEVKQDRLLGFANGQYRVLITKPKIGAWGPELSAL